MNRKTVSDCVRKLLGRRFVQREVDLLDAAIDRALKTSPRTSAARQTVDESGW